MKKYTSALLPLVFAYGANAQTIDYSTIFTVDGVSASLGSLDNPIYSAFGPRNPGNAIGTRFHPGIDLFPISKYPSIKGKIITARSNGKIIWISKKNTYGNTLYVKFASGVFGFHHIFENGSGPVTLTEEPNFTISEITALTSKGVPKICGAIFNKLKHTVLLAQECPPANGSTLNYNYNGYSAWKVIKEVTTGQQLAVVGNSGAPQSHLHLFYGYPEKRNPLYKLNHGNDHSYSVSFQDQDSINPIPTAWAAPSFTSSELPKIVWVNINFSKGKDLDGVQFQIDNGPVGEYRFGGEPATSVIPNSISPSLCGSNATLACHIRIGSSKTPQQDSVYAVPTISPNYDKSLAFGIPIPSLSVGTHYLYLNTISVNQDFGFNVLQFKVNSPAAEFCITPWPARFVATGQATVTTTCPDGVNTSEFALSRIYFTGVVDGRDLKSAGMCGVTSDISTGWFGGAFDPNYNVNGAMGKITLNIPSQRYQGAVTRTGTDSVVETFTQILDWFDANTGALGSCTTQFSFSGKLAPVSPQ